MKDNSKDLEKDPYFVNDIVVEMRASRTHVNMANPEVLALSQDQLKGAVKNFELIAGKVQIDLLVGKDPIKATMSNGRYKRREALIAAGSRLALKSVYDGQFIVGNETKSYFLDPKITAQSLVNGGDFITVSY